MATRTILKIGDVFEIRLPNECLCYCQYISRNDQLGFLIRVFAHLSTDPTQLNELDMSTLMFPPVFVGLQATARSGRWKRIGNLPVADFEFPKFRQTIGTKPGEYHDWRIWDGDEAKFIGKLPVHLRALELECVWGDEALEERIIAGSCRGDQMV